jgi:hypothetical protein
MTVPITADEIESRVSNALKALIEADHYLLENDLNECSINHMLACHLQSQFEAWHVDCEYNKNYEKAKELELPKDKVDWNDTEAKSVFPDIIVHKRGGDGPNLLVIEVKKSSNKSDRRHDYNKLKQYGAVLSYSCALFLKIGTKGNFGSWSLDWTKRSDFTG